MYIRMRGRVIGPFNEDELKKKARRNELSRIHELSADGADWKPASEPEFAHLFPDRGHVPELIRSQAVEEQSNDSSVDMLSDEDVLSIDPVLVGGQEDSSSGEADWYFEFNGQPQGPMTLQEILTAGQFTGQTRVWRTGWADWVPAANVAEFASALQPMPDGSPIRQGVLEPINSPIGTGSGSPIAQRPDRRSASNKTKLIWICSASGAALVLLFLILLISGGDSMVSLLKERIAILESLVEILETVEDRRAANRAADQIKELGDDFRDIVNRGEDFLEGLTSKQERVLEEDLEDALDTDVGRRLKRVQRKLVAVMASIDTKYQAEIAKALKTWPAGGDFLADFL